MDFSCYVTVTNNCKTALMLQHKDKGKNDKGKWEVEPPNVIAGGTSQQFVLKDALGTEGTEGSVEYALNAPKNPGVRICFSCPATPGSKNTFTAKSSEPSIMKVEQDGPHKPDGHPMHGKKFPSIFYFRPCQSFSPLLKVLRTIGAATCSLV